jgi:hypothetical protein
MKLTDEQKSTLLNALHVAASRFQADLSVLTSVPGTVCRDLVLIFEKQEADTHALFELVQDADSVEVTQAEDEPHPCCHGAGHVCRRST